MVRTCTGLPRRRTMFKPSCTLFRRSCALFAGGAAPFLQETNCADALQPCTPIADALVIGGGVVGVAVARDIAVRGDTVVLLVHTPPYHAPLCWCTPHSAMQRCAAGAHPTLPCSFYHFTQSLHCRNHCDKPLRVWVSGRANAAGLRVGNLCCG